MSIGQGARAWAAYSALSAPLTMMGVERRWFLLSATIGMAMTLLHGSSRRMSYHWFFNAGGSLNAT